MYNVTRSLRMSEYAGLVVCGTRKDLRDRGLRACFLGFVLHETFANVSSHKNFEQATSYRARDSSRLLVTCELRNSRSRHERDWLFISKTEQAVGVVVVVVVILVLYWVVYTE